MGNGCAVESKKKNKKKKKKIPSSCRSSLCSKKMKYVDYPFIEPIFYPSSFSSIFHFMYRGTLPDVLQSFCSKFC